MSCFRHSLSGPSPIEDSTLRLVLAVPTAHKFRPRGFSPPRRLRPSVRCGFVAPHSQTGFAVLPDRQTPIRRCWRCRPFPTTHSPFEAFPSLVAVPHHCGRFPLDVSRNLTLIEDLTVFAASDISDPACAARSEEPPSPSVHRPSPSLLKSSPT